jgi:sugar/nucleoside kinase (ribokinase family)
VKRRRRVGVIGTLVWDVIYGRDAARGPTEEWGGIAYSLAAMDAAIGEEWEIVPLLRVGGDLAAAAREFTRSLSHVSGEASVIEVAHRNFRVALTYHPDGRRTEILTGAIPPWHWLGLKPLLSDLDALYVNFNTGHELELEVARLLRQHFSGPVYGDLHSLLHPQLAGVGTSGLPLQQALQWVTCFDVIQLNEQELLSVAAGPLEFASAAIAAGTRCVVVTLADRGVVYFTSGDFTLTARGPAGGELGKPAPPVRTALVPAAIAPSGADSDTTGCGDVWGATYFSRLLAGDNFAHAIDSAMNAAARNVGFRGTAALSAWLRRGLATR